MDRGSPTVPAGPVGSGPADPGPGQQGVDLGPEGPPGDALGLGELRQGARIADAGQVAVGSPVLERLLDQQARRASPESSTFAQAARSAFSQSSAWPRSLAFAPSSGLGSSVPWPAAASAAAQAAL